MKVKLNLRQKINLYTTVLFIALLVFMNVTVYFLFKNLIIDVETQEAALEFQNIQYGVTSGMNTMAVDELLRAYLPIDGALQIVLPDQTAAALVTSIDEQHVSDLIPYYYREGFTDLMLIGDTNYYFQSVPIIWTDGSIANLQMLKSVQNAFDQIIILRFVLIAVTLIATIPIVASSRFLEKLIINPITSMIATMKEIIQSGEFKRLTIQTHTNDELTDMGETFNHMVDLLETNYQKQEQFVANASHELKTPLTVIESYASLIKRRGTGNPEIIKEAVEAIHSEAKRMIDLTEQLVLLAKPEQQMDLQFAPVDLEQFLTNLHQSLHMTYDREISYQSQDSVKVLTDKKKLQQLIFIFLDNAIKYSEKPISIISGRNEKEGFIRIIDRGIGIPKEELDKIFDRFYRVDHARTRKTGGTGLGLALARDIARAINARLDIDSVVTAGTSVTIYLPLTEDENNLADEIKRATTHPQLDEGGAP